MSRKPFGIRLLALAFLWLAFVTAQAATITVNSTANTAANDGVCTLREAIIAANTNTASGALAGECVAGTAGLDTIAFAIPGAGVKTITPASPLPAITEAVFINGYTQPGASPNTNALNAGINAVLRIELNGDTAGGLLINAAGSVIRGLNIHSALGDNIEVNASNVTIAGNFLGTNPAGTATGSAAGNENIRLTAGDNNVIGGPAAADRNLVSSDTSDKIFITSGNGTLIQGNYVGTDVTGTLALNETAFAHNGIATHNPASNTIILGNLISGNSGGGVQMGSFGNPGGGGVIQGNLIGTQRDGVSALGNLNSGGLDLAQDGVVVGGTGPGQGNTIAFNSGGVHIYSNFVGNSILGNSIYSNGALLGIRLSSGANDACDVDTLPGNRGQNYPVITSAPVAAGNVTISGTLNSTASTTFRLEFFSNAACHPSGNGEGRTLLGFANVTTDATCNASFNNLSFPAAGGPVITATATVNPSAGVFTDTSEFSACLGAVAVADLTISKTHSGNFTQGQIGATYTITVTNSGAGATTGTVTVSDSVPAGLTATNASGSGWTCGVTCTRSDVLAAGASYPSITLTVNVAGNAPASVTNTATVSGGGETNTANDSASDNTTINAVVADLTVTKTHAGNFTQGQIGATYTITVTNSGAGVTVGTVTVVDTLPAGLTPTSVAGTGWTCNIVALTCTRGDALVSGASYPPITLTVSVANNAPPSVINTATVSGGGETNTANDTTTDPTTVTPLPVVQIPTLHGPLLALLGLLLAAAAARLQRRKGASAGC